MSKRVSFSMKSDVARAETAPASLYVDPAVLPIEQEAIFGKTWQLFGSNAALTSEGDFATGEIAGRSIVAVREKDTIRAFHNVCRHRAGPLATGCGHRQTLQCRYHGWTYALDGRLLRAPEMEGTKFDPEKVRLVEVRAESWGPLLFVNLDPKAAPLAKTLADVPRLAAPLGLDKMTFVHRREYEIACNWKVYVDNYLEGYHLPMVHPGLYKELDYERYQVEPRGTYSIQHAPLREAKGPDRKYAPEREGDDAQYYWFFPNIMLNVYLGQMQTNSIVPIDHRRTRTIFEWYAATAPMEGDAKWKRLLDFSDEIQNEDIGICEAVQKNLESGVYERGRYSAKRENGLHQFHSLLSRSLSKKSNIRGA